MVNNSSIAPTICSQKVHYCIRKGTSTVPILKNLNQLHILPPFFCKIHFNINPCSNLRVQIGTSHSSCLTKPLHAFLASNLRPTRPAHPILQLHISRNTFIPAVNSTIILFWNVLKEKFQPHTDLCRCVENFHLLHVQEELFWPLLPLYVKFFPYRQLMTHKPICTNIVHICLWQK